MNGDKKKEERKEVNHCLLLLLCGVPRTGKAMMPMTNACDASLYRSTRRKLATAVVLNLCPIER